jgi:hypothetical protein
MRKILKMIHLSVVPGFKNKENFGVEREKVSEWQGRCPERAEAGYPEVRKAGSCFVVIVFFFEISSLFSHPESHWL